MLSFEDAVIPKPSGIDTLVENFNTCQAGYNDLSQTDKEFFYWVNYSRQNPKRFYDSVVLPIIKIYPQLKGDNLQSLKNDLYTKMTLPLFSLNPILSKMAFSHSIDITSNNFSPSHSSSTVKLFKTVLKPLI